MSVSFQVNVAQAAALGGFLQEMSVKIGTPQHVGPVLRYVHSKMSEDFTVHMSAVAKSYPSRFHHVYEWGGLGDPSQQLWEDVLVGGGSVRTASFRWLASKKSVPVRADFAEVGVQQVHIFTWKAPVMEYSTNLTISPTRGGRLAYFTGPSNPVDKWPMKFTTKSITVQYPGGRQVKGAFTREYVSWWSGAGASGIFSAGIRKLLEEDLAHMPLRSLLSKFGYTFKGGTRSRQKTFGIATLADTEAAVFAGREAANAWLNARDRVYIGGAEARAAIIGGLDG